MIVLDRVRGSVKDKLFFAVRGERIEIYVSNKHQAQKGKYFTCLRDLFSVSLG
jgi:hypothetical protein